MEEVIAVNRIIYSLAAMSRCDWLMDKGKRDEAIELIHMEQNNWKVNSAGWNVLESLKSYILDISEKE